MLLVRSAILVLASSWLYYHSWFAVIPLLPVWLWLYQERERELQKKKQNEFLGQFKEMIQSMASALNTGYSAENALREAQKELQMLYPKAGVLGEEMVFMTRQTRLQIPLEQVLEEFAQRVELEDVRNFAAVFAAAKRSGGDMLAIIQNTVHQIGDKIEVKREIDTLLAAKQYEFRIMSAVPYLIIAYMAVSFPEFMTCLYGNIIGIGVMTVCLFIYAGAYALGARLVKIEV